MNPTKYLVPIVVGLLLIPSFSFAATIGEQQHTLLLELISLIQQEITSLQAQLALQTANVSQGADLSSESHVSTTTQVNTIIQQLGSTNMNSSSIVNPAYPFDAFVSSVSQTPDGTFMSIESNKVLKLDSLSFSNGVSVVEMIELATNSLYKNTHQTSYQYKFRMTGVDKGVVFNIELTDTDGYSLTKQAQL